MHLDDGINTSIAIKILKHNDFDVELVHSPTFVTESGHVGTIKAKSFDNVDQLLEHLSKDDKIYLYNCESRWIKNPIMGEIEFSIMFRYTTQSELISNN